MAHARIIANQFPGSLTGFGQHRRIIANQFPGSLTEFSAVTSEIVNTLELQNLLNKLGAGLVADGLFGNKTRTAIEAVASRYNLNYSYSKGKLWDKANPSRGKTSITPSGFMNALRMTVAKETAAPITIEPVKPITVPEPIEIPTKVQQPVYTTPPLKPPPPAIPAPPVEIEIEEEVPIYEPAPPVYEPPPVAYKPPPVTTPAITTKEPEEWYEGELLGVPTMFWIGGSVALSGITALLALKIKKGKKAK